MALTVLYSSLRDNEDRRKVECAVRGSLIGRDGKWRVAMIDPPGQRLLVIILDGPNGWSKTWVFEDGEQDAATIRKHLLADLPATHLEPE